MTGIGTMRKIAFYCSGRNELPPDGISGVKFFPDRASMWDELAKRIPDAEISVYFTPPGEFTADMGLKITRFPERVSYVLLDGTETVEEIAGRIAGDHPDLAIAFSIPVLPFDWSALRDAMVGEELRLRGIRTIAHSVRFTYDSFEKDRMSEDLRRNGFNVARSVTVQNGLYHAHLTDPSIPQNVYREFMLRKIRELRFPVIIKPTVFSGAEGLMVAKGFDDAEEKLDKWKLDSDILVEEQIIGEIFGIELYGTHGQYHVMEPVIFSSNSDGVTDSIASIKTGPVLDEKYNIDHLKKEMVRMAELFDMSGAAQVDLVFSEGAWYVLEINPRYTTMSDLSAVIEGKRALDIYGEMAMGDHQNPVGEERRLKAGGTDESRADFDGREHRFACDFKTRILDQEEICRLRDKYSSIAQVMRVQTAVSSVGLVEYCEFVMAADTKEELIKDIQSIRDDNKDIIDDEVYRSLQYYLLERWLKK